MTREAVRNWCDLLSKSWLNTDFQQILSIFSDVEYYYEDPFSAPGSSAADIKSYWEEIVFQKIKELKMTPLAIDGNTAIIRWYLDYIDTRTGEEIIMDGIYQVEFNEFGKCTMFIQWWVMKE